MNRQISNGKSSQKPVLLWVLLGISAALTVGLMVFLGLRLIFNVGAGKAAENTRYPYSDEEESEYFRGFDATVLAASVCGAYPEADGATLALGADECFLRMDIRDGELTVPLHFSLRSTDMAFTGEFPGYNRASLYTSFVLENIQAAETLSARYVNHLEEMGGDVTAVYFRDYDCDGLDESIILVADFLDQWLEDAGGNDAQRTASEPLMEKRVCVYLDPGSGDDLVIHSAALPDSLGNVTEAVWDNGMIHLLSGDELYRFIASECELSVADFDRDSAAMRRLCARFADLMADQGYTDIRLRLADVSTAPGDELLCCYSDGRNYYAAVYAVRNGCLYQLYRKAGTDGSVYLIEYNGGEYLLDYAQDLSDDYAQSYSYKLFRFDDGYSLRVEESDSLRVEANQGGGSAGSSFFSRLNGYLNAGSVCYDPYGLMGYTVMQEHGDMVTGGEQALYLNITNCSTNKVGVITLQDDDSWLNFRSGPSTAYDRVLINTYDPESYVKQVQGSLVTVIMPYNTGDRDNPIWAQIRINYQNRTLEGYSSQRFIRIDGIRHVAVGERFQITAQTNDTGLRWYCSDTAVASIGNDGTLTGIKPGLVLVTVISDSGLEDSCLVMID